MALDLSILSLSDTAAALVVPKTAAAVQRGCTDLAPRLPPSPVAVAIRNEHGDAWDNARESYRAEAQEWLRCIREVWDLWLGGRGVPIEQACAMVAMRSAQTYPTLAHGGQKGRTLIRKENIRKKIEAMGRRSDGQPEWRNIAALLPGYQTGPRGRRGSDAWWQEFEKVRLSRGRERMTLKGAYDEVARHWLAAGLPSGDVPKFKHVEREIRLHAPAVLEEFAAGPTAMRRRVLGYLARDWSLIRDGELWIGDNRKLDFLVKGWAPDGRPRPTRLWCTAWRDARSGHVVAMSLYPGDEAPDAEAIIETFYQGVQRAGFVVPLYIMIDNGKDFVARGFTTPVKLGGREFSIVAQTGVGVVTCLKFNPQAKTVERTFRDYAMGFDRLQVGWIGPSTDKRPEGAWKWAQEHFDELPSIRQIWEALCEWNCVHESAMTASAIQDGIPSLTRWENRAPVREPVSPEQFHKMMLRPYPETRRVRRVAGFGPGVEFEGWHYSARELLEHYDREVIIKLDVLAGRVPRLGRQVRSHIYVYTLDGRAICRAEAAETHDALAVARGPDQREQLGAAMRDIRSVYRDAEKLFLEHTGLSAPVSPVEALRGIYLSAGVPVPASLQPGTPVAPALPGARSKRKAIPADSAAAARGPVADAAPASAPYTDADPDLVRELEALRAGAHLSQAAAPGAAAHPQETGDQDQDLLAQILADTHEERDR
jgi:hypothetical protein